MKRKHLLLVLVTLIIAAMALVPVTAYASPDDLGYIPEDTPPQSWESLGGSDRYQTSARVCRSAFETAQTVVIASGEGFSDALAASPLAGLYDAPIMVVPSQGELPLPIAREIARLGAGNAIVVGGTSAVSDEMVGQIEAITGSVERIAGKDRIDTCLRILTRLGKVNYQTAIVVNGSNYPDALSVASYAYAAKLPIILTQADGTLRADTVKAVKQAGCSRVLMIGGTSVVSDSVVDALGMRDTGNRGEDLYTQRNRRIAGSDRYDTNAQVLSWEIGTYGGITIGSYIDALVPTSTDMVYVASGEGYADALSAAAAAGHTGCALALTAEFEQGILPAQALKKYGRVARGYIVGGDAALSWEAMKRFWNVLYG